MKLHNRTPYRVSAFVKQIEPGEPFLTVVVVGTFRLRPGEACEALPADGQEGATGPQFYNDRFGNSRVRDGDAPSFKQRADCLFIGSAHAPRGQAVPFLDVTFGVGNLRKTLRIVGDRHWLRLADGSVVVEGPHPFTEMPIRDEFAHGGFRSAFNKHGKGFGDLPAAPGSTLPLANVVSPAREATPWTEDEMPEGFGALPTETRPRVDLQGTFDEAWLYRRRPFAPVDFDMAFYNSARPDQQVEGYLEGDEELHFENLHPDLPVYRARLPGTRVRLFAHHVPGTSEPQLVEIMTVLDTCIVDMRNETVRLVWRGTMARVESEDVEQLADLLVVEEPCAAPAPREAHLARLEEAIAARRPAEQGPTGAQLDEIAALNEEAVAEAVATLKKYGADEALIAEVAASRTADEALDVVMKYVETLTRQLPEPPA